MNVNLDGRVGIALSVDKPGGSIDEAPLLDPLPERLDEDVVVEQDREVRITPILIAEFCGRHFALLQRRPRRHVSRRVRLILGGLQLLVVPEGSEHLLLAEPRLLRSTRDLDCYVGEVDLCPVSSQLRGIVEMSVGLLDGDRHLRLALLLQPPHLLLLIVSEIAEALGFDKFA